jgi:hypothetical protein
MNAIQTAWERHQKEVSEAVDAAQRAIEEYHGGDKSWAEGWLLKAYKANHLEEELDRELAEFERRHAKENE